MARNASITGFDFDQSLLPAERIKAAEYFVPKGASAPTLWERAQNLNLPLSQTYGKGAPDLGAAIGLDSSQFLGGQAKSSQGWTFITAPQDISWETANAVDRVNMFGTNNPPLVSGSRGMRDLNLSDSLVEGFIRQKNVEAKISSLEDLLNYKLNPSDGFVSVPVYQIWANNKSYGGANGYFIIKSVRIKEEMRDIKGNSTRAKVDVSLLQVPEYQVNTGRDQASKTTSGGAAITPAGKGGSTANSQANQGVTGKGGTNPAAPGAKPAAGPSSAPTPAPKPREKALPGTDIKRRPNPTP